MNNMEGRLGELNTMSEKVMQYEIKINRMSSQFQGFEREKIEFEDVRKENETLKRRVGELGEASVKVNEYEFKIEMAAREIERLNTILENKNK